MLTVGFGVTALARGLSGEGVDGIGHYTQSLFQCMQSQSNLQLSPFSFGMETKKTDFNQPVLLREKLPKELIQGVFLPSKRFSQNMQKPKLDLVHATDHLIPFSKDVPLLATIMDAIPLSHPEWVRAGLLSKLKAALWKKMAQRADHIVTISDYSKAQIIEYFSIDDAKISVVPLGVDKRFFEVIDTQEKKAILNKHKISKSYVLSVGTLQPRKNVESSLAAMALL